MKKHLIRTAVCIAAALTMQMLPASAYYYRDQHVSTAQDLGTISSGYLVEGNATFHCDSSYMRGFIVIADDDSSVDTSWFEDVQDYTSCKYVIVDEEDSDTWGYDFPDGTKLYEVYVSSYDHLMQSVQRFSLEHPEVSGVYLKKHLTMCDLTWYTGQIMLDISSPELIPDTDIRGFQTLESRNGADEYNYYAELDPQVIPLSDQPEDAGKNLQAALTFLDEVRTDYPDLIQSYYLPGSIDFSEIENDRMEQADSPELGDVNLDGRIDASDAAEILQHAAALGSGSDAGQPAFFETLADVNSDNLCNAEDARMILIQAAQQGAG